MRSHGFPQFPDPTNNGTNVKILTGGSGIQPDTPQVNSAESACSALLPGGGASGRSISAAGRLDYLKAAACVRSRRHPLPRPHLRGRTGQLPHSGVDLSNSPVVARAIATCRTLIPAGLPYRGGHEALEARKPLQ
jgi:hypothetical protein